MAGLSGSFEAVSTTGGVVWLAHSAIEGCGSGCAGGFWAFGWLSCCRRQRSEAISVGAGISNSCNCSLSRVSISAVVDWIRGSSRSQQLQMRSRFWRSNRDC